MTPYFNPRIHWLAKKDMLRAGCIFQIPFEMGWVGENKITGTNHTCVYVCILRSMYLHIFVYKTRFNYIYIILTINANQAKPRKKLTHSPPTKLTIELIFWWSLVFTFSKIPIFFVVLFWDCPFWKCFLSCWNPHLGGGFKNILYFHPENWGHHPILTCAYVSNGLKRSTTNYRYVYTYIYI